MMKWGHGIAALMLFASIVSHISSAFTLGTSTGVSYATAKPGDVKEFTFYVFGRGNGMSITLSADSELPVYISPGTYLNPDTCVPYKHIKTSSGMVRACEVKVNVEVDRDEEGRYPVRILVKAWENGARAGTSARVVQVREVVFVVDVSGRKIIDYLPEVARPVANIMFRGEQGSEIRPAEGKISVGNADAGTVERIVDNPLTPVREDDVARATGFVVKKTGKPGMVSIIAAIVAIGLMLLMWLS